MSPMDYIKDNVSVTSARKLLYGCVFKKFRIKTDEREENLMLAKVAIVIVALFFPCCFCVFKEIINALNMVMGKDLSEKQAKNFRELVAWSDDERIDFKTFCGICALCERLLAIEYCPHMPGKKADPCHEVKTKTNKSSFLFCYVIDAILDRNCRF